MPLEKDSVIECEIESLAFGGRGVGRVDGMAVFVAGGLPGDTVTARITKSKKRFAEAVMETIVTPSEQRVEPVCKHFGTCGGCAIQDLDYAEQLKQKAAQVESSLNRIGGVDNLTMDEPVASPSTWRYRNKMEFAFEQETGVEMRLGLRSIPEKGEKLGKVFDLEECHLCAIRDVDIMHTVRDFCRETEVTAYHPQTGSGFWRHLVIRHTSIGQVQVNIITTADERKYNLPEELAEVLMDRFPEVVSFVHSTRVKRSTIAMGERTIYRLGHKFVEERLPKGDDLLQYHLSPNTFFQTNSAGAVELFGTISEYGEFTGKETLLDLYCGAGAIGLYLSKEVRRVIGYEVSDEAIGKAWASAKLNRINNCEFFAHSLNNGIQAMDKLPSIDVIVVDPPRSGMQEETAKSILRLAPKKIIAVSCDPATLARDVKRLSDKYEISRARAVDMFPHTHHIETVTLLVRK